MFKHIQYLAIVFSDRECDLSTSRIDSKHFVAHQVHVKRVDGKEGKAIRQAAEENSCNDGLRVNAQGEKDWENDSGHDEYRDEDEVGHRPSL